MKLLFQMKPQPVVQPFSASNVPQKLEYVETPNHSHFNQLFDSLDHSKISEDQIAKTILSKEFKKVETVVLNDEYKGYVPVGKQDFLVESVTKQLFECTIETPTTPVVCEFVLPVVKKLN